MNTKASESSSETIREEVRRRYGATASGASCCSDDCCTATAATNLGYSEADRAAAPESADLGLGCGNPVAIASLREGQTVLDLGSGAGFDCFLAARAVGQTGKIIGVDMTHEMLSKARGNAQKNGFTNVEFRLGEIEALPVADNSVDVIISNCVINLSGDKDRVLREAFRVLRPGGRFAVSDVVGRGAVPEAVRHNMSLWIGCIAGALQEDEYRAKLAAAGFEDISIEITRAYRAEDAREFLAAGGLDADALAPALDGKFAGAFIRANKPAACCGPGCCQG